MMVPSVAGPSSSLVMRKPMEPLWSGWAATNSSTATTIAAIEVFMSDAPRPNSLPSRCVGTNGGDCHLSTGPVGTTSACLAAFVFRSDGREGDQFLGQGKGFAHDEFVQSVLENLLIKVSSKADMRRLTAGVQYRTFDDGRQLDDQRRGAGIVGDAGLALIGQAAPGRTFAIDQCVPGDVLEPGFHQAGVEARFLEIVEGVRDAIGVEPGARLLDRVVIGNAVESDLRAHKINILSYKK